MALLAWQKIHYQCLKIERGNKMKTLILATSLVLALSGCAGMSTRDSNIVGGAALGGVTGAVLGGGTLGTLGGAAVGGLIGNEVGKNAERRDQRDYRNDRRQDRREYRQDRYGNRYDRYGNRY